MREAETQRDILCIISSFMPEPNVRERINGYAGLVHKPFRLAAVVQSVAVDIPFREEGT
jgi:hypothetical protein